MRSIPSMIGRVVFAVIFAGTGGGVLLGCGAKATPSHVKTAPESTTPAKRRPITTIAPPTPIQKKRVELGGPTWKTSWDRVIELSIPHSMLTEDVPRDVQRFCPRFYRMSTPDKREFWAYFFQALAAAEAGLNPRANVRHTEPQVAVRDEVTGKMVHSEGLLQLAYEDSKRYGCSFNWKRDRELGPDSPSRSILNPINNLECGIKILSHQIIAQHKPLLSPTGYWSTLHPGTPDHQVFVKQMANTPRFCRVPPAELAGRRKTTPRSDDNQLALASPAVEEESEASNP